VIKYHKQHHTHLADINQNHNEYMFQLMHNSNPHELEDFPSINRKKKKKKKKQKNFQQKKNLKPKKIKDFP